MKQPINVTITGAAGQIGYALAFRVASGAMLGPDQPVNLHLLEITPALAALQGVVMELNDCAFPTLNARRRDGRCEGGAFATAARRCSSARGRAARAWSARTCCSPTRRSSPRRARSSTRSRVATSRCSSSAIPANTNALIASRNAKDIDARNFTAMTRLDHNRALAQLAEKTGTHVNDIRRMIIWGNHSSTQFPDLHHATVKGQAALSLVDQAWYSETFIPTVQQRGAAVIKARGASSAASAASAAIDHIRTWMLGSAPGDYVSMGVPADGSYGIAEGVIYSYPVTTANGSYTIVQGLAVNEFSRARLTATDKELREERDGVKDLI